MRIALLGILAGLLALAPALALEQRGNVVTLDDEEVAACTAGGGCIIVPRAVLMQVLREACGSKTI